MHLWELAGVDPHKAAMVFPASGTVVSYDELDSASTKIAALFTSLGLTPGDSVAICMENRKELIEAAWGAQRSGLYYTVASTRLREDELRYIVADCGAKVVLTSAALLGEVHAATKDSSALVARLIAGADAPGWTRLDVALGALDPAAVAPELEGADMLYSSGTTGRPKGVKVPLPLDPFPGRNGLADLLKSLYGFDDSTVYLSPAPLYHAAPLRFNLVNHRLGGTSVIMDRFDPVEYLRLVGEFGVTHSQLVPTMFVRMLKLPEDVRLNSDVSTLRAAVHAAAPCPVQVKSEMMEWWGPVIHEYYAGTEGNGFVACSPEDWLSHPGSVGRAILGKVHIVGEDGSELPVGEEGTIYFSDGPQFEYHNDPDKTRSVYNERGWSTLGDVGRLDEEGFLYLTDRRSFMIISGGVNIYPQEAENVLVTHPRVADAAVIGVPNEEFGEEVKAIVELLDPSDAGPEMEAELIAFCRARLADVKCPRSVDFRAELPRMPTGKLLKRLLRDEYWQGRDSKII